MRSALLALVLSVASFGTDSHGQVQSNGVYREIFTGLSGSSLLGLTNDSNYPLFPSLTDVLTNFFEGPYNYGDYFGDRFRALIFPPVTGAYVFWVAGDDQAALFLSPDEGSANKVQIAGNTLTALYRTWYNYPSQQSSNIFLEAGRRYYIEAIHSAGSGDDAFAVGWKLPNGTLEQPIPITRLKPYGQPATMVPTLLSHPANTTVSENSPAVFRVAITNLDAVSYQWLRNGAPMSGVVGGSYTIPAASTNDHGINVRCVVSNSLGTVTSLGATLTVVADTTRPVLASAANLNFNTVQVLFTEPVEPASATNIANYSLNNGILILGAATGPTTREILLTTSPLAAGTNYTLTASNVRDLAAARNVLLPNSQQSFTALIKGVYREIFTDLIGVQLGDLTNSPAYPNNPASAELLTNAMETPAFALNNYGQRLRARIIPPVTGGYTFSISAHDTASLRLGTNSLPSSAREIASVSAASLVTVRQWDVQTNQRSASISLVAGQQYYIEVLMKGGISSGFPSDHLAVRWQWPGGLLEEPISVSRLTPYGMNLPLITNQPSNVVAIEGSAATFSVAVANVDPVTFQWQQNGTNVPGATNAIYTDALATLAENGSSIRCLLSNALGSTNTDSATLTVTPDVARPFMTSVVNNSSNRVVVTYSEPVDATTATNAANYSIPNVTLSSPVLSANGNSVTLTVGAPGLAFGSNYTLTVNRVRDRATSFNVIATNSQWAFTVEQFFLQEIGTAAPGTVSHVAGGVNLQAGNGVFNSTNDAFTFAWQQVRGDFDLKVRVARLEFADTWSVAGLMAREDLSTNSRYAGMFCTPSVAGSFFRYRTNAGVLPQSSGAFPVNYPYTWLRVQRVGGTRFNGFASYDGALWTQLGSVTISMPSTIYLGFVADASDANADAGGGGGTVTAEFRDFGANTSTALGVSSGGIEAPGPSTRRTGLVISELMYHPAERTDGRRLEFIEIYNSNPFAQDIGGFRISGDVSYTFPPGTVLPGGAYRVVARDPGDLQAVQGVASVLGPYSGSLPNDRGTVRLRNREDAVLLEVNYRSGPPWPAQADGAGHSLVLVRPSLGEDDPRAWAASDAMGGSPGAVNGVGFESARNVVINEFLAHTDLPEVDFIELYNHGSVPVDLSGFWLTDDPSTNKYRIANGTVLGARGFVSFTESVLGFALDAGGETIYLVSSNRTRVVDAVRFGGQQNGVSTGRWPDGAPGFHPLSGKSPGGTNAPLRLAQLVINEIMYNPISGLDADEFLEIHNRGSNAVNLTNWRINDGVEFRFPTNASVAAGGYVVVAKNVARMLTNYTGLTTNNTFGPYSGTLANGGERITLTMPDSVVSTNLFGTLLTNLIHIEVDEVSYGTGGRWGKWSDGGGSSLELIDPRSDNRLASNWTDSDDTAKSTWTALSATGYLDNADEGSGDWDSVQIMLLEEGECLVDLVDVRFPSIGNNGNTITNGSFENTPLMNHWVAQGTHRLSYVTNTTTPSGGGARALHVIATDGGDTGANRIFTILNAEYTTNISGTISAQVKWLHGRPDIVIRLRGNLHELAGVMNVPKNLGTPGARNSRYATNAGPAISEVLHTPILPAANQPVVVTARLHDPDGIASAQLVWRVDPFGTAVTTNMTDNGLNGDAVANDGLYSATIPGQADDALVAFYVQTTDRFTPAATLRFPKDAPVRECLIHYGDSQPNSTYGTYRFWMTQSTHNNWLLREKLSNEPYEGAFVYGDYRVIYNAASHYAGSPAHTDQYDGPMGTNCDYQILLPGDDTLLSAKSVRVQQPGLVGADATGQSEQTGYWIISQFGVPTLNRRPINLFINGLRRGIIYEDTQRQNSDFDEQWYPDSEPGDLHKVSYWYEYTDDTLGHDNVRPSLVPFTTTNGVKKLARYRQNFPKRALKDTAHNYTNLFNLVDLLDTTLTGEDYANRVFPHIDVVEWARSFAVERIVNNTDVYGARRLDGDRTKPGGQNAFLYKPLNDSWKFYVWDIDAGFLGTPVDPFFDFTDPPISNLFSQPLVLRIYWQALEDAAYGPLDPVNLHPPMDARYAAYRASGINVAPPTKLKDFLGIRRDYILQLLSENRSDSRITSNNGLDFTNAGTLATLTGTAPFAARTITINGIRYPLHWTSVTNWTARIALSGPTNRIVVESFDANGQPLPNFTDSITIYYNGAVSRPEESLVINEIMFQPSVSNAHYVEIFNRSTNTTFDLWNYRINGIDFHFQPGDVISPQSYLVVARDELAFQAAYGGGIPIAGEFNGNLDRDGESLSLIREALTTNEVDVTIDRVKYEIVPPWPSAPGRTNSRVALQLIDPAQDNGRVSNWDDGSAWRFVRFTVAPASSSPTLYLWLDGVGEVFIDDVRVVHGFTAATGSNYVRNSDFEQSFSGNWTFVGGSSTSYAYATNTPAAKSGANSVRLVLGASGSTSRCLSQSLSGLSSSSSSNYTVSFWYRPTTNANNLTVRLGGSSFALTSNVRPVTATPGALNFTAGTVSPYPLLWLNEVQPNNLAGHLDNTGTPQPWLELFNTSTNPLSLDGYHLSKSYANLAQWPFPAGTILQPGEFRVLYVDGRTNFSSGTNLHTSFRLDPTNGAIVLSKTTSSGELQLLDYINYTNMLPGVSRGSYPDGQLFDRQLFYVATPGASNNPAPVPVAINEWLASNTRTMVDPSTGTYEDWFELYNFGLAEVNLSGFYLTDDTANKKKWRVPDGIIMPPQAFLFCWADGDATGTNMAGNALHAGFKLSKNGGELALYSPDGIKVDKVSFGAQVSDVSQGKYADGNAAGPNYFMPTTTPGTNNVITNNLYAPVLTAIGNLNGSEGGLVTFTNHATDSDVPAQSMAFALVGNVPEGAAIDPVTGVFTWAPTEMHGGQVFSISVQVTDNGGPPLFDTETFTVTVAEVNNPPAIGSIANQTIDPGALLSVLVPATDSDVPAQTLAYALVEAPSGAGVDAGGNFTWTPSEAQANSTNAIVVTVTDGGSPSMSTTQSFTVVVNPPNPCGGYKGDVAPRIGGNGSVTISDWVQIGRFAAGLADISNSCEFAKSDCAPKPCGNGSVTISDWVQAGRYAAGLDNLTSMLDCPPPGGGFAPAAALFFPASASRALCITNTAIEQGTTNCVRVILEAEGDENAVGFSLHYDTNRLTYIATRVGDDVVDALINVNARTNGRVGVTLALQPDQSFLPGPIVVVEVCFRAISVTNPVSTSVQLGDQPTVREVSDVLANVLPATYRNGTVVITRGTDFLFEAISLPTPGQVKLRLIGEAGAAWAIQKSSDLQNWQTITTVTNTCGLVEHIDPAAASPPQRFYRAVKP